MTYREAAEQVLFGTTLEQKLALAPANADDNSPGSPIALPSQPGRPHHLRIRPHGVKASFPGTHHLDREPERSTLLHFLANHELLAAELMALVLLRFPHAPAAYRAGVFAAMREEQMHTRLYLRRMKDSGIHFGDLPLNDFFWKLVSPMEHPIDFITRLNLTFEQANLDFSLHYSKLFRQAGDDATAAVLEKIYRDEIGHVGHGLEWFRHWKNPAQSDWEAYRTHLPAQLHASRAKGNAPFNPQGRRLAGLDEDFIRQLEVCSTSRGRTPIVHYFQPDAEARSLAQSSSRTYHPKKADLELAADLESLLIACTRRDDILLCRKLPSTTHLAYLQNRGIELPEFHPLSSPLDRKLGGLRPWAWDPDSSATLAPLAHTLAPNLPFTWQKPLDPYLFSKDFGIDTLRHLSPNLHHSTRVDSWETLETAVLQHLPLRPALVKSPWACAGRGHLLIDAWPLPAATATGLQRRLNSQGHLWIEPFLNRVLDFSALYENASGSFRLVGFTRMENDPAGRFLGTLVAPRWTHGLPAEITRFLQESSGYLSFFNDTLPRHLNTRLPHYRGALGVDAMVHRLPDQSLALHPIVEINTRCTMGRIALELLQRHPTPISQARLRLLRLPSTTSLDSLLADPHLTVLNDPSHARRILGIWDTTPT